MDLPDNWDFIPNSIPSEKLAELRRRFMEEWRFFRSILGRLGTAIS